MGEPRVVHYAEEYATHTACGRLVRVGYRYTVDVRQVSCVKCREQPLVVERWVEQAGRYLRHTQQGPAWVWECDVCAGRWQVSPAPSVAAARVLSEQFRFEHRACLLKAPPVPLELEPAGVVYRRARPKFV